MKEPVLAGTALQPVGLPCLPTFAAFSAAALAAPLLSAEEELGLFAAWKQEHSRAAVMEIVRSHLRIVVKVVREHAAYKMTQEDLAQEGVVGLLRALKGFDPVAHAGVRFSGYAVHWVVAEIRAFILANWRIVKLSGGQAKKLFFGFRKHLRALSLEHGEKPFKGCIPPLPGVSQEDMKSAAAYFGGADIAVTGTDEREDESSHLMSSTPLLLTAPEQSDPGITLEVLDSADYRSRWLKAALDKLSERQRQILKYRRLQAPPATLKEVADKLGMSIEGVRKGEAKAMQVLTSFASVG